MASNLTLRPESYSLNTKKTKHPINLNMLPPSQQGISIFKKSNKNQIASQYKEMGMKLATNKLTTNTLFKKCSFKNTQNTLSIINTGASKLLKFQVKRKLAPSNLSNSNNNSKISAKLSTSQQPKMALEKKNTFQDTSFPKIEQHSKNLNSFKTNQTLYLPKTTRTTISLSNNKTNNISSNKANNISNSITTKVILPYNQPPNRKKSKIKKCALNSFAIKLEDLFPSNNTSINNIKKEHETIKSSVNTSVNTGTVHNIISNNLINKVKKKPAEKKATIDLLMRKTTDDFNNINSKGLKKSNED